MKLVSAIICILIVFVLGMEVQKSLDTHSHHHLGIGDSGRVFHPQQVQVIELEYGEKSLFEKVEPPLTCELDSRARIEVGANWQKKSGEIGSAGVIYTPNELHPVRLHNECPVGGIFTINSEEEFYKITEFDRKQ